MTLEMFYPNAKILQVIAFKMQPMISVLFLDTYKYKLTSLNRL